MELDKNLECMACGAMFEVIYDEEQPVRYCPCCGEELIEELDFSD